MTISNEVLAERIEGFTRQMLAESQQVRRDFTTTIEEMGRVKDTMAAMADAQTRHEKLDGHRVSMLQIGALEKDTHKAKQDIEQLRELVSLKTDVAKLKLDVLAIQGDQSSAVAFSDGRKSALSTAEKIILLLVATSGPLFVLAERMGI